MAVDPLPPTNTERWFYDYTVGGFQHSLIVRVSSPQSAIDVADAIHAFLTALDTYLAEITTVGLRVALEGSNITNPEATTGLDTTYGSGAQGAIYAPVQTTFPCRSQDGHKGRVGMFGAANLSDASYRIHTSENAQIAAAQTVLNTYAPGLMFVTISGARGFYKLYANTGVNDHFVKEIRQSGGTA